MVGAGREQRRVTATEATVVGPERETAARAVQAEEDVEEAWRVGGGEGRGEGVRRGTLVRWPWPVYSSGGFRLKRASYHLAKLTSGAARDRERREGRGRGHEEGENDRAEHLGYV